MNLSRIRTALADAGVRPAKKLGQNFLHDQNLARWIVEQANISADDLIADVQDGVYIEGDGSYSIDQQRYNLQFGGQVFWEIKNGKKTVMLRDVAYQSRTPDFWNSCDGVGSREHYRLGGSYFDAKGEPTQINAVSHGCPPARFRKINIINTGRKI